MTWRRTRQDLPKTGFTALRGIKFQAVDVAKGLVSVKKKIENGYWSTGDVRMATSCKVSDTTAWCD